MYSKYREKYNEEINEFEKIISNLRNYFTNKIPYNEEKINLEFSKNENLQNSYENKEKPISENSEILKIQSELLQIKQENTNIEKEIIILKNIKNEF